MAFLTPSLPLTFTNRKQLSSSPRPHAKPTCSIHRRRPGLSDVVNQDNIRDIQVGGIAVPRHLWRRDLRQHGIHRSVEYIIERLSLDDNDIQHLMEAPAPRRGDVVASIRPAGALISRLEREWPVSVSVEDGILWSYKRDVAISAVVCAGLAVTFIAGGFFVGEIGGVYSIASASMVPTLIKGDAIFVEKVSVRAAPVRRGEVVVVRPPPQVKRDARVGGRKLRFRDALVKRVVAVGGDIVQVDENGTGIVRVNGKIVGRGVAEEWAKYMRVGTFRVKEGLVYVMGDNGRASVDSRFWGCLPAADVMGRPVARIFPPERIGLWGQEGRR